MISATPPIEPMRIEFDFKRPSVVPTAALQQTRTAG